MQSCTFSNCNFSLVKLDGCHLQNVQFSDFKITGDEFFQMREDIFLSEF
ncbi:pentapeptide repeat-containing protein [Candidatus Protochlamydia amoebophila]|uniref:Pentapeptide repeat-containing protein n=1 Tax=Protochlamydia amoebophila (strain UWE25) TaxID=264201 RepID=A0A2P9HAA7_PARUW|nr:unnamed protein product [Candidatus Protochlamydia amoebophila UWE25]